MRDLLKAVVVTRGRTGSSAITQELGQAPGCRSEQEIFGQAAPMELFDFPPFEAWRRERPAGDEAGLAEAYLEALEADARARGCRALFWKLLSNQYVERPYMGDLLRDRGYRAIHLTRAPARQVLSGLVAHQSGVYVTYERPSPRRYRIDVESLRDLTKVEQFGASRDEAWLYKYGLKAIPATYEEYLADRAALFARLYRELGLPEALPEPTRFVLTLPDLKAAIANYEEVRSVAAEFGESL